MIRNGGSSIDSVLAATLAGAAVESVWELRRLRRRREATSLSDADYQHALQQLRGERVPFGSRDGHVA